MSTGATDNVIYEFGAFRLDPVERLLVRDGRAVPLTPKAFDLLVCLLERHGGPRSADSIHAALLFWASTAFRRTCIAHVII